MVVRGGGGREIWYIFYEDSTGIFVVLKQFYILMVAVVLLHDKLHRNTHTAEI